MMPIKKVALIGANGTLGPAILNALLASTSFIVTVLSRSSSKSTYPTSVRVTNISDDPTREELAQTLQGQDALVVTFAGSNSELQIRLANAAAQAGVKRFIPADFGSCDSSSPRALELVPLYGAKQRVREHLQQLASSSDLTWTSLVSGHFFDYGLKSGLLGFDLGACKARIFDGGDIKWSTTTLETIGTAIVRVLQKDNATANQMLYIQSFCITQNKLLRSVEQIMGKTWQVEHLNSADYIKKVKEEVDRDPKDSEAMENLVSVVGIVDSNWEGKENFASSLLALEDESLDRILSKVIGE